MIRALELNSLAKLSAFWRKHSVWIDRNAATTGQAMLSRHRTHNQRRVQPGQSGAADVSDT